MKGACRFTSTPGIVGRVEISEALGDDVAGFPLVSPGDFRRGHLARHRYFAGKIVGMGGAEDRDRPARLREGGCLRRMGVHDAADMREGEVQIAMRRRVGRGIEHALDALAVEIGDDHVGDGQRLVGDAARLDGEHLRARSIALALPKAGLISPCRGRAMLASKASRFRSSYMARSYCGWRAAAEASALMSSSAFITPDRSAERLSPPKPTSNEDRVERVELVHTERAGSGA